MNQRHPFIRRHGRTTALAVLACSVLAAPSPLGAQRAATLFEQAQAREQAVAAPESPVTDLRAAARAYEALVLKYPASGYADDALWQAAGLMERAFGKSGARSDLDKAIKWLGWLQREYPTSRLVPEARARIAVLQSATGSASEPAARPAAPSSPPRAAPSTPLHTATNQAAGATVRNVTQTGLPRGDRVTIELSQEVEVQSDRVANPDRVFFDFPNATAAAALAARAKEINTALIRSVRVGRPTPGVTRVVLELAGNPRHSAFPLYSPYRLVVDLETDAIEPRAGPLPIGVTAPAAVMEGTTPLPLPPAPDRRSDASAPGEPAPDRRPAARPAAPITPPLVVSPGLPNITSKGDYSLARQLGLGVSRIVIDAGHGGHDPGAQAHGINEAELVLDVALRLQKLLADRPGFDVVLTRKSDEFIPLEERTAIANREEADLFLSIHANASRQSAARGIETYILNFASNPAAEAVAARENATSAQTMGTLPAILRAIALNNKLAESRELATIVQTSLVRKLRAQNSAARDLGVKQAPFVVLIGAQMPSVLAEISFLTNKSEAALLKQSGYRQQIAQALCDAVVKYQASLKKITTVANR